MASYISIFLPPVTVKTLKVGHFHSVEYTRLLPRLFEPHDACEADGLMIMIFLCSLIREKQTTKAIKINVQQQRLGLN